jgi:hypothetical protein
VQVFADNATKPAFEVGFTSFNPTKPAASVFRFNPPPGTKVTEGEALGGPDRPRPGPKAGPDGHDGPLSLLAGAEPEVVGKGWTSVLVAKLPRGEDQEKGDASTSSMLRMLPEVSGSWGSGHLLRGSLFSVLVTDDGRVAVGAVPPSQLYAALTAR